MKCKSQNFRKIVGGVCASVIFALGANADDRKKRDRDSDKDAGDRLTDAIALQYAADFFRSVDAFGPFRLPDLKRLPHGKGKGIHGVHPYAHLLNGDGDAGDRLTDAIALQYAADFFRSVDAFGPFRLPDFNRLPHYKDKGDRGVHGKRPRHGGKEGDPGDRLTDAIAAQYAADFFRSVDAFGEFRTRRGKVYRDCRVLSRDDYGVMIRHRGGAARLAFSDLTPPLQQHFGYDAAKARQYVQRHTPIRTSLLAHDRALATNFVGFSPQYAATRAHLAFAGGLLGAPFGGSLSVPGMKSFDAWQTNTYYARHNPYHSSHTYKVKNGNVHLTNRRRTDRFDCAKNYHYAFRPQPQHRPSYLYNYNNFGVPIAPPMNGGHITATNALNPIAPAMMSYSQFQQSRARAIRKTAPPRRAFIPGGGARLK